MHLNQSNGFPCRCSDCEHERRRGRALDAIADTVLAYRPQAKSKPARRRKREAAKIAKEK
jgi:hypothetical protein